MGTKSRRLAVERETLGPLPVLAVGAGAPLLYLGGLLPVAGVDSSLARRSAAFSARPFAGTRRVLYTNRRRGLAPGMTLAEIAAEHAAAIAALGRDAVDVVGVSTGGSIAQQLAADHPESVRRLVLIGTGCRLSPATRRLQMRVAREVRAGNPQHALAAMAVGVFFPRGDSLARLLAPLLSPLLGRLGDLGDLATTIEAEDRFDLARCGRAIAAPTLIAAGARDRFYPRPLLEETQRLIPGSLLRMAPRRGHLTALNDPRLMAAVGAFLAR